MVHSLYYKHSILCVFLVFFICPYRSCCLLLKVLRWNIVHWKAKVVRHMPVCRRDFGFSPTSTMASRTGQSTTTLTTTETYIELMKSASGDGGTAPALWDCSVQMETLQCRTVWDLGRNSSAGQLGRTKKTSVQWSFRKQEQWERWRPKQKLVSGSKHRGRFCRGTGVSPRKIFEVVYEKSCNPVHFGRKMVRNAVNYAFLNTNNRNSVPCTRFPSKWPLHPPSQYHISRLRVL